MADVRTTGFLDLFDRPAEEPISFNGKWAQTDTGLWSPMKGLTGGATHANGHGSSDSYWTAPSLSGDCEVWGYTLGGGATGIAWGLGLIQNAGGVDGISGYRYRIEDFTGGNGHLLYKITNGSITNIAGIQPAPVNGNVYMLLRRKGSNVECWADASGTGNSFVLVLSVVDTTYTTDLKPSMGIADISLGQILTWSAFGGGKPNNQQIFRWFSA